MAKDKMRRQYQRSFNHKIRQLNKEIERDELWRGRFVFLQKQYHWYKFEDNSGGILTLFIRAYDKKTNYYHDYRLEYAPWLKSINWRLSMDIANTFIVDDLNVWGNEDRPNIKTAPDFTKTKVNVEALMRLPWNFHIKNDKFEDWLADSRKSLDFLQRKRGTNYESSKII